MTSRDRELIEHRRAGLALAGTSTVLCPECGSITQVPVIHQLEEGLNIEQFTCDSCSEDLEIRVSVEVPGLSVSHDTADFMTRDEITDLIREQISSLEATMLELIQTVEERWIALAQAQWEASPPAEKVVHLNRPKRQNQR